jgi:DNA-binding MarR family transcriptional regulator
MAKRITGSELRDRLLARMRQPAPEANEELRIEILASVVNRELLGIIATKQPRSINELAMLSGRLQPNVSRALNALARAGLLTVTPDGRASIPALTTEGERKARDLGFAPVAELPAPRRVEPATDGPVLSANILGPRGVDLDNDAIDAEITARLPGLGVTTITARATCDLNEACKHILRSWWRLLYRRADPFRLFKLERPIGREVSRAMLLAEAMGQKVKLLARSLAEEDDDWDFPALTLEQSEFRSLILNELVEPAIKYLQGGRRFDRPVAALRRRIEDIERYPEEFLFWRTAGALGLAQTEIEAPLAENISRLIAAIVDEDARLDFASGTNPTYVAMTLNWALTEIGAKSGTNCLPRLVELREKNAAQAAAGWRPHRIGTTRARLAREQLNIGGDRSVGGIAGLARMLGGRGAFAPSPAGEDVIRGFQGHGDGEPVVVVKGEGPRSTSFLVTRAVGDYLVFGSREAPIADLYTDRQAVGRAFAAEFLAPARGVIHMIEEEQQPMMAVADHYGVNLDVIDWQYRNNAALRTQT